MDTIIKTINLHRGAYYQLRTSLDGYTILFVQEGHVTNTKYIVADNDNDAIRQLKNIVDRIKIMRSR